MCTNHDKLRICLFWNLEVNIRYKRASRTISIFYCQNIVSCSIFRIVNCQICTENRPFIFIRKRFYLKLLYLKIYYVIIQISERFSHKLFFYLNLTSVHVYNALIDQKMIYMRNYMKYPNNETSHLPVYSL